MRPRQIFFIFYFFYLGRFSPKWAEIALIRFDSVRIRRGRRKICYQKICEKKTRGMRRRKICYQMICEERRRRRRRWCGDVVDEAQVLASTIETLCSGTFTKGKVWWQMIVDFQIRPWNVILIKQFIMAKYFDNCINWNNYLSLKNNIILQNLLPKY